MPRPLQAMAQVPIGVSNRAKPWALMGSILLLTGHPVKWSQPSSNWHRPWIAFGGSMFRAGVVGLIYPRAESNSLLKQAVRRHRSCPAKGLLEKLFERLFRGLVYAQIWEDPEVDLEAMALTPDCHVVAIASGGCNVLSYLTADPARITAVDLSRAHVALNRLKLMAAQPPAVLADYSIASSARPTRGQFAAYDRQITPHLDAESRAYWEGPQPASGRPPPHLDLRAQCLSPRRAGPLHRRGPCRRPRLRRRLRQAARARARSRSSGTSSTRCWRRCSTSRPCAGPPSSRALALRARHPAGAVRGAGRRPRHGLGAARPRRAAGLRLQPRRQLLRLAGLRPRLCARRQRAVAALSAAGEFPCGAARAPSGSR